MIAIYKRLEAAFTLNKRLEAASTLCKRQDAASTFFAHDGTPLTCQVILRQAVPHSDPCGGHSNWQV